MFHFFSNCCTALVDEQGRALTGMALEAAQKNPHARRCGNEIPLRAPYCSKCGAPAPKSWVRCGQCGEWIGSESLFCPHCNHRQNPGASVMIQDGQFVKDGSLFAQQLVLQDVTHQIRNGVVIREGQMALLVQDGRLQGSYPPGRYTAADLGNLDLSFNAVQRHVLILVDYGELSFDILCGGLYSKESLPLELRMTLRLKFDHTHALDFLSNVFWNREYSEDGAAGRLSYGTLVRRMIMSVVEASAKEFCAAYALEEIFKDARLHLALEDKVREGVAGELQSNGFLFVRLSGVEFTGNAYESIRRESKTLELERRRQEFELKARRLSAEGVQEKEKLEREIGLQRLKENQSDERERARLTQAQELEIAKLAHAKEGELKRLAHEMSIQDEVLNAELERLKSDLGFDMRIEKLKQEEELAALKLDGEHRLAEKRRLEETAQFDHDMLKIEKEQQRILKEQNALIQQTIQDQGVFQSSRTFEQDLRERQKESERRDAAAKVNNDIRKVEALNNADPIAIMTTVTDVMQMHHIKEMFKQKSHNNMTPEQLLGEAAAAGSREAAQALSNIRGGGGVDLAGLTSTLQSMQATANAQTNEVIKALLNALEKFSGNTSAPQPPPQGPTNIIMK